MYICVKIVENQVSRLSKLSLFFVVFTFLCMNNSKKLRIIFSFFFTFIIIVKRY